MIPKRLKVAHVIPELDLNITGGVGVFLRTLTQCLDGDRVESVIVTFKSDEIDRQFFQDLEIPVFSRLLTAEEDIEPSIQVMEWLIQTFQTLFPDVVHTNLFWGDTLGRQAAYRAKVPVIVTTENNRDLQETPRQRSIKRKLVAFTDRVICVSEAVRQHSRDVDNIPDDRLSVIYNGILLQNYPFPNLDRSSQKSEFVFVGRLEPQKNPLRLIEAFSFIAAEHLDCQLSIIGDGSLFVQCQDYIRQLKLGDRVHCLGYQPHPWKVAPSGSIFVHCCDFEGFGLSIAEAMASGHLCVLPKIDGVPEVATEGSEAIFYEGDLNSLVEALQYALKMPISQQMQMIQAARTRVERYFDAHRMAEQYLDLYQRLYKKKSGGSRFSTLTSELPTIYQYKVEREKKLRIAHVIHSLEKLPWGGVMTFLEFFLDGLDKEKTENFIVAYEALPDRCKRFENMGIPVFSRLQEKPIQSAKSIEVTQWLIQIFGHIQPHVVQTHVGPGETMARLAASYAKVPVIVCRENNVHEKATEKHLSLSLRLAKITDRVVCISEAVKRSTCEVKKIPESLTTIIYNGLQLNEYVFRSIEPTNQFVYVGRLEPQKAPLRLLQAFSTIVSDYPDSHLSLIGDGSLMSDCQEYVKYLKLDDRVHFLGYHAKPWQYAPPGSIFVHCCDYEGFGTAITEAMASGHLCVLPKIDGVPEVATEGSEAIFYEGDRHSLVDAMRCALEMPAAQKLQMIQAAQSRVERDFDARRMTEQYLDLYQTLYAQKQGKYNR